MAPPLTVFRHGLEKMSRLLFNWARRARLKLFVSMVLLTAELNLVEFEDTNREMLYNYGSTEPAVPHEVISRTDGRFTKKKEQLRNLYQK